MKHNIQLSFVILITLNFISVISLKAEQLRVPSASFSTSIAEQDDNVKRNIIIACEKLNGTVIRANSVFSFNDTVGEGSTKNGFMMGRVLYRDRIVMEPGGGLCQVSSTLFNAFLLAGCVIIERHRHYQPVTYVPLGLDATIKYGKKDLKIKNPYDFNITLEVKMNEKNLIVAIIAEKGFRYMYQVFTDEEIIPLPAGDDADKIRHGISVHVYRKKYLDGRIVDNALLYKDYYPPVYER